MLRSIARAYRRDETALVATAQPLVTVFRRRLAAFGSGSAYPPEDEWSEEHEANEEPHEDAPTFGLLACCGFSNNVSATTMGVQRDQKDPPTGTRVADRLRHRDEHADESKASANRRAVTFHRSRCYAAADGCSFGGSPTYRPSLASWV